MSENKAQPYICTYETGMNVAIPEKAKKQKLQQKKNKTKNLQTLSFFGCHAIYPVQIEPNPTCLGHYNCPHSFAHIGEFK